MANLERLNGPYVAKKWEFIYTDGFPVRQGKKFWIIYDTDKNQTFTDSKNEIILPKRKNKTLYGEYLKIKGTLKREFYYKPHKLIVLKKHRKKGGITRCFVRKNDVKLSRIFEIKEQKFSMASVFYDKVSLNWKLDGSEGDIKLQNTKALEEADKILPGIKDLLDPLEFYIKEDLTVKERVEVALQMLGPVHNIVDGQIKGVTSKVEGHVHNYIVDFDGNGTALTTYHPIEENIFHSHAIIEFVIQSAQSGCYREDQEDSDSCYSLYGIAGAPPHIHYIPIVENPEDIKDKYLYKTREEAKSVAAGLGLKSVHLMKNGYWMPGKNHKNLMESLSTD